MMKMKRTILLVTCALLVLATLCGCSDNGSGDMISSVEHLVPMPKPGGGGTQKNNTADPSEIKVTDNTDKTNADAPQQSAAETSGEPENNVVVTEDPPKTEEPKKEEPKTEEPKTEEPKTEEPKTEEPKTEEPKTEEPKTEEPKTEEPSTDTEWNLILVNPWNYLPEDFDVKMTTIKGGHKIDERAYPDLQDMMDDMRAAGLSPYICSSYRTVSYQQGLYDKQVKKQKAKGLSDEEARTEAARWVAIPGTSEHHTGLALDIVASDYVVLDETQEKEPEQQWLIQNSWKYGFILRYPNGKTDITGIYYEPWHYRYVGKTVAKEIYESGVTFEEYIQNRR